MSASTIVVALNAQFLRRVDQMPGHDKGGDDAEALTVQPGKTGRLTHTFDWPGTFEIRCHQPGHYATGMKVAVTVA